MAENERHQRTRLEAALDARLPALIGEVQALLVDDWPDYAEFLDTDAAAVKEAGERFVASLLDAAIGDAASGRPESAEEDMHEVFQYVGRRQWQVGHRLPELLSAYQVGARTAWRHVSAAALEVGVGSALLAALAEAVFDFVSRLSASSARGFVLAQAEDAASRERSREELAELLLSGRAGMPAIRTTAARAGWPLPATAAVALARSEEVVRHLLALLGEHRALPIRRDGLAGLVVPDPDAPGRREEIRRVLQGSEALLGFVVGLEVLPRSVETAEIGVRLKACGALPDEAVFIDEYPDTLIVRRDDRLLAYLQRVALAPLDELSEARRARMVETLSAWLQHMGDRSAIAEELRIHPQTVRYRLARLREHFGDELDRPEVRARLFLALEWTVS